MSPQVCFACDKPLKKWMYMVGTKDGQTVYVGAGCFKKINRSADLGYHPPKGGPSLLAYFKGAKMPVENTLKGSHSK